MLFRSFRAVNDVTNLDVIALDDAGGGTAATAACIVAGTATAARTIYITVASATTSRYEIDVETGDTAAAVGAKILAAATADTEAPFTAALVTATVTFTAASKGTHANTWLISALDAYDRPAIVPGLTFTLTGWSAGATNPTLTTLFDDVQNIRYQNIVYPEAYASSYLAAFVDARKNVDNDIKDEIGRAHV